MAIAGPVTGGSHGGGGGGSGLPPGGTDGQALRKLGAGAEWSVYWVVDPTTGAMASALPVAPGPLTGYAEEAPPLLSATGGVDDVTVALGYPVTTVVSKLGVSQLGSFQLSFAAPGLGIGPAVQWGTGCFQIGASSTQKVSFGSFQLGLSNTQTSPHSLQFGSANSQTGFGATDLAQFGAENTQSGIYNSQFGYQNTQSGQVGFQAGESLNDGGYSYTFMVGNTKTAVVGDRAYFATINGLWLKPKAGDVATPEDGVIGYNSTLQRFRGYANGAFVDIGITVGDTAPAAPVVGQLWLDTSP